MREMRRSFSEKCGLRECCVSANSVRRVMRYEETRRSSPTLSFRLVCVMSRCLTHFVRYFRIRGPTIRVSGSGISHRQRVAMAAIVLEEVRMV